MDLPRNPRAVAAATPREPGAPPKGPTTEKGIPAPVFNLTGLGPNGIQPTFVDDREYAPDLRWPLSVGVYARMEGGDAQVKGLLLATTLPVRRLLWEIDPNGAEPRVVDHIAQDFDLPIRGGDPTAPSPAGGFNHDRHLAHALRALTMGHFYFERVYRYSNPRDGGDGLMHLAKLATRPPRMIQNFIISEHGELLGIVQPPVVGTIGAYTLADYGQITGIPIDANSLLAYVWDSEDDGDWIGRSLLRPAYRDWLLKDRLVRVDANLHERNGMGIPWFETAADATQKQIDDLAEMAMAVRAGTRGGGAGPGKLQIKGVEGTLPDTIGSVRYHDQQISKAFLAPWFDLGTSETGARALGETMVEQAVLMQDTIADWYAAATQAQIEDSVLTNFGEDVQMPKISWTRVATRDATIEDLVKAVDSGLIEVTPAFRAAIAERHKIAGQSPEEVDAEKARKAAAAPPVAAPAPAEDPDHEGALAASEKPPEQPKRSALADQMLTVMSGPMTWPQLAEAVGRDRRDGTARRARDLLLAEGAIYRRAADERLAPLAAIPLPDRDLKRNPNVVEVEAAVNFEQMDRVYEDAVDVLVAAVSGAQSAQIAEARAAVEAAAGNAAKLAQITVAPVDADVITPTLSEVAAEGVASARQEREAQQIGPAAVAAAEPDSAALDRMVTERAEAVAATLAAGLSASAAKKAAAVSTLAPEAAAAAVAEHLESLTEAALREQLGGAVQQSYNGGRRNYMAVNQPSAVYASEILDRNTCTACNGIDGTEYPSVEASEGDYPTGGYASCEGGLRCRGTIVAVY